jgi:hypothetical protein
MQQPDSQQQQEEGGYPCSMFVTPPEADLKCSICIDVLRDPVQVCGNRHTYCTHCIAQSKASNNTRCPECRAPLKEELVPATKERDEIMQLVVHCSHAVYEAAPSSVAVSVPATSTPTCAPLSEKPMPATKERDEILLLEVRCPHAGCGGSVCGGVCMVCGRVGVGGGGDGVLEGGGVGGGGVCCEGGMWGGVGVGVCGGVGVGGGGGGGCGGVGVGGGGGGCGGGGGEGAGPSSVSVLATCGWTGPLADYEAHVELCPFMQISCPYAEAGCVFRAARRDMNAHSCDMAAHSHIMMACAAVKAECAVMKSDINSLQVRVYIYTYILYVHILYIYSILYTIY